MVREPGATMQPTPQNNQLMSKHRVLSLKPQLRLEWRGQDGQSETEQPDHSASLGDSIRLSTRIRFSVHTGGGQGVAGHSIAHPASGDRTLFGRQRFHKGRVGRCFACELTLIAICTALFIFGISVLSRVEAQLTSHASSTSLLASRHMPMW